MVQSNCALFHMEIGLGHNPYVAIIATMVGWDRKQSRKVVTGHYDNMTSRIFTTAFEQH